MTLQMKYLIPAPHISTYTNSKNQVKDLSMFKDLTRLLYLSFLYPSSTKNLEKLKENNHKRNKIA